MSAGERPGSGSPGRREVVVRCASPGPFVDFCVLGLGLEVEGWDETGGVVTSVDGAVAVRVLDGVPAPLEIALAVAPADFALLAEAAVEAGAEVAAAGEGAIVVRGPESVTWRVTAAPPGAAAPGPAAP